MGRRRRPHGVQHLDQLEERRRPRRRGDRLRRARGDDELRVAHQVELDPRRRAPVLAGTAGGPAAAAAPRRRRDPGAPAGAHGLREPHNLGDLGPRARRRPGAFGGAGSRPRLLRRPLGGALGRAPPPRAACGVAALLELARHLRDQPPARSVVLVATGSHFQGDQGLFQFLDRHARRLPLFRNRMPKRFVADSLKVDKLVRQTADLGIPLDTLGVRLGDSGGGPVLESVDLERLTAQLKRRRIKPDSLGIRLEPDSLDIDLFLALDLSSQSDQVGLVHSARLSAHRRFFVSLGRSFSRHAAAAAAALGREPNGLVNLVSPIKGLSWDSYLDDDVFYRGRPHRARRGPGDPQPGDHHRPPRRSSTAPWTGPTGSTSATWQRQSEMINHVLTRALADPGLFGPEWEKLGPAHDKQPARPPGRHRRPAAAAAEALGHARGPGAPRHRGHPQRLLPRHVAARGSPWPTRRATTPSTACSRAGSRCTPSSSTRRRGEITFATDLGERAQKIGGWRADPDQARDGVDDDPLRGREHRDPRPHPRRLPLHLRQLRAAA